MHETPSVLRAAGGLTAAATLAGCSMLGGASTGTLAARASDQPVADEVTVETTCDDGATATNTTM
jgi:hypothetical protein